MSQSDTGRSALLKEMLRQVGLSFKDKSDAYAAAFNDAAKASKPTPCCYCFCQGQEGTLENLPWKGAFGAVICGRCKSRFAFMDPERPADVA